MKTRKLLIALPMLICGVGKLQATELPLEAIGKITLRSDGLLKSGTGILLFKPGYFLTSLHNITYCFQGGKNPAARYSQRLIGQSCRKNVLIEFPQASTKVVIHEFKIVDLGNLQLTNQNAPYRDWVLLKLEHPALANFRYPQIFLSGISMEYGPIRVLGFPQVPAGERVLPLVASGQRHLAYAHDFSTPSYIDFGAAANLSSEGSIDHIGLRQTQGFLRSKSATVNLWKRLYGELGLSSERLTWLFNMVSQNFFKDSSNLFYHAAVATGYSGGPIFDSKNRLIGINWGSLAVWSENFGPMPNHVIGLDPQSPKKHSNGLAAGQNLKMIIDKLMGRRLKAQL